MVFFSTETISYVILLVDEQVEGNDDDDGQDECQPGFYKGEHIATPLLHTLEQNAHTFGIQLFLTVSTKKFMQLMITAAM